MSTSAVQEVSIVSIYMKQKLPHFLERGLGGPDSPDVEIKHPLSWSLEFAMEVDLALDVLARAFRNQGIVFLGYSRNILLILTVSTKWDVRRYADHIGLKYTGINDQYEETLQRMFKPLKVDHLEIAPCIITDRHGHILLWYLPNILRPERQVA
jgi:hypothetical protein